MLKRRVFIAINFPGDFKKRILAFQKKWKTLPVRWIKPENLHLTIIPPMHLNDDELHRLIMAAKTAGGQSADFELDFDKFTYGPPGKPIRMIWLSGPASTKLAQLRQVIENEILAHNIPFRQENRPLTPHITVARMIEDEWRPYAPKPNIEELWRISVPVTAIDIMESELKRGGAEYRVLESVPLGK